VVGVSPEPDGTATTPGSESPSRLHLAEWIDLHANPGFESAYDPQTTPGGVQQW
jgi:hypothetical protein